MLLRLNPVEEKTAKIILTFLGIELHVFPRAAKTSYNKLSDLSQHEFILLHSWMSEVQNEFSEARIKVSAELVSSGGLSPSFVDGCLLIVSLHGLYSMHMHPLVSLCMSK